MFRFEIDANSKLQRAWISKKGHPYEIYIIENRPDRPIVGYQEREFELEEVSLTEFMECVKEMGAVEELLKYLESEECNAT